MCDEVFVVGDVVVANVSPNHWAYGLEFRVYEIERMSDGSGVCLKVVSISTPNTFSASIGRFRKAPRMDGRRVLMMEYLTIACRHCGNPLSSRERRVNEVSYGIHGINFGLCKLCWDAYGEAIFGVQAGVPKERRVSFSDRSKKWEGRLIPDNTYKPPVRTTIVGQDRAAFSSNGSCILPWSIEWDAAISETTRIYVWFPNDEAASRWREDPHIAPFLVEMELRREDETTIYGPLSIHRYYWNPYTSGWVWTIARTGKSKRRVTLQS